MVETNVHFPTDIHLLFDAIRKIIQQTAELCEHHKRSDWRQFRHNIKRFKRLMRIIQKKKHSRSKNESQKNKVEQAIKDAHQAYIELAQTYLDKAQATLKSVDESVKLKMEDLPLIASIADFVVHADRQIDQIKRRVLQGEKIPHHEKVFSLFEPHTEWIVKGKAGVPMELGLRVCILEDQYQFILHHRVMEKETDDKVAIPMIQETKARFPELNRCSFDKGFHSKENQEGLSQELEVVALPRKGKLSKKAQEIEKSENFIKAHDKHSAVESAINALEVHGLDLCPDHGIDGFKRYTALAIVAKNLDRVGALIKRGEQKKEARRLKHDRGSTFKRAA